MPDIKQLYWLAGLLDGEASFITNGNSPVIKLTMTDKDLVEKVSKMFDRPMYEYKQGRLKTIYVVTVGSNDAIAWMQTLYSLMGQRRKNQIKSIILKWKNFTPTYGERPREFCFRGHKLIAENRDKDGRCKTCRRSYDRNVRGTTVLARKNSAFKSRIIGYFNS